MPVKYRVQEVREGIFAVQRSFGGWDWETVTERQAFPPFGGVADVKLEYSSKDEAIIKAEFLHRKSLFVPNTVWESKP